MEKRESITYADVIRLRETTDNVYALCKELAVKARIAAQHNKKEFEASLESSMLDEELYDEALHMSQCTMLAKEFGKKDRPIFDAVHAYIEEKKQGEKPSES